MGKGHPGGEQEGEGTQENCSATWPTVLGFMVMGSVSHGLWPVILIQSLSWWHTHRSAKMHASKRDSGKWTDTRCLLLTFPELFLLVVAYWFRIPYRDLLSQNNSCEWLLKGLARVGSFSQCACPNRKSHYLQKIRYLKIIYKF